MINWEMLTQNTPLCSGFPPLICLNIVWTWMSTKSWYWWWFEYEFSFRLSTKLFHIIMKIWMLFSGLRNVKRLNIYHSVRCNVIWFPSNTFRKLKRKRCLSKTVIGQYFVKDDLNRASIFWPSYSRFSSSSSIRVSHLFVTKYVWVVSEFTVSRWEADKIHFSCQKK